MLEVDERLLEDRRRRGIDRWDEMWEGVLHMVPPPSGRHQDVARDLFLTLAPLAKALGLVPWYETGLFRPGVDDDYRVPDQMYTRRELVTDRGVDGPADLVVEIRSPHDETDQKLPWYAALGVREVLVLDPETLVVELHQDGRPVEPDAVGALRTDVLGARFETTTGGGLRITWDGGEARIT